jgi:hypothetical protein
MTDNKAIEVAREIQEAGDSSDILYVDDYAIRVKPIPAAIITDVTNRIAEPPVPTWYNKEYDREEANPNNPEYVRAKEDVARKRGEAMIDATIMFGMELVDGVPPAEEWMPRLQFLSKRGQLDLDQYDLNDQLEREYVFKRYVIGNIALITYIQTISSVVPEDIGKAAAPFRRKKAR